jgi:DNA polymerase-3 subunit beta
MAVTQVEIEGQGETLVIADTLAKIVRECPDEVLSMETVGNMLHIRGSGSRFQIVTLDPADFPAVPAMEGKPDFTIEHAVLRRMIELSAFAAARESTRYAINGVYWKVEGNRLTLAATDGRRLAVAKGSLLEHGKADPPPIIVPTKSLSLFARLTMEEGARVSVKVTRNQLILDLGRALLATSLVEGQFPNYHDVIPGDCDRIARIATDEMHSALKRAALLTNEESKGVRFSFSEGNLTLSSRAPEQGEAEVSMPVAFKGEPLDIGFNPVFLLDVLRVAHTEELSFAVKEPNRPGMINVGDDFIYVVMPVNLSSA